MLCKLGTFVCLVVLSPVSTSLLGAAEGDDVIVPGDIAVVSNDGTKLMLGAEVVAELTEGMRIQVERVVGEWVGGHVALNGKRTAGWVRRGEVEFGPSAPEVAPDAGRTLLEISRKLDEVKEEVSKLRSEIADPQSSDEQLFTQCSGTMTWADGSKRAVTGLAGQKDAGSALFSRSVRLPTHLEVIDRAEYGAPTYEIPLQEISVLRVSTPPDEERYSDVTRIHVTYNDGKTKEYRSSVNRSLAVRFEDDHAIAIYEYDELGGATIEVTRNDSR